MAIAGANADEEWASEVDDEEEQAPRLKENEPCCTRRCVAVPRRFCVRHRRGVCACCSLLVLAALWFLALPALLAKYVLGVSFCGDIEAGNRPEAFYGDVCGWHDLDFSSFFLSAGAYSSVTFPARDGLEGLKGLWLRNSSSPESHRTVIIVHDLGSCMKRYEVLLPASMLLARGFNVLAFDMREHGSSPSVVSYPSAGCRDYADVLGAFDFLVSKGVPEDRIGFLANSMAVASVLNALAEEPRMSGGMWFDSAAYGFRDVADIRMRSLLGFSLVPSSLVWGHMKTYAQCDLDAWSAQAALAKVKGRRRLPRLRLIHSVMDKMVPLYLSQRFERDAFEIGFHVGGGVAAVQTSTPLIDGTSIWTARSCPEHGTVQLVNPSAYGALLGKFFEGALGT